ncbi:MAG: hypothetical protein RLZZ453_722 [Chlamydiota bacterium]|jgi:type II secretory pathway component GspD/PulD (secretin)
MKASIFLLCASLIYSPVAFTMDAIEPVAFGSDTPSTKDNYTINFNNVSIIELIRFTSKISGLNFIFEEADLQFSVTVVSEEAVTAKSVLSVLSQVLRMRNLNLVEQGGNVLITSSKKINQIPRIISSSEPQSHEESATALVTRVFQIKNTNITSVAGIIRPLISDTALLEILPETKQLIVTDIPTNVDQIHTLLTIIDTPQSPLEIESYVVKNIAPSDLIPTVKELLAPFVEGNSLILVPQAATNSIYIVSTAYLIEKAMTILEDLDRAPASTAVTPSSQSDFFVYHPKNKTGEALSQEVDQLAQNLSSSGFSDSHLLQALRSMHWNKGANSLVFTGTPAAIEKVKSLLATLDVKEGTPFSLQGTSFFVYTPKYLSVEEIQAALRAVLHSSTNTGLQDPSLVRTVNSMHTVDSSGAIIFSGPPDALQKIQQLLTAIDVPQVGEIEDVSDVTFLVYRAHYVAPDALAASMKQFAMHLDQGNVSNRNLIQALNNVTIIPDKQSLLFTGNKPTLVQIEGLLKRFDNPELGQKEPLIDRQVSNFVIYSPHYASGPELISILQEFVQTLSQAGVKDPALFDAVNNLKWVPKTSSLIISGSPEAITQIQLLLSQFDVPGAEGASSSIESIDNTSFLVYKLQYHPGNDIQSALKQIAASLDVKETKAPKELVQAIDSVQWLQVTNSLLCTGPQDVLVRLKDLIRNLDVPLRQVFIEVLVIETTLNNQQNFGLMWGGQVKYLNRTILNSGNFPVSTGSGSLVPAPPTGMTPFQTGLQNINGSTTPTNTSIPFTTGFDLGVIGDIIMHKGKSFISLGSLMNALQQDIDSTVLLNPKIIAQDNRQSTIFVGQNIPYTGSIVTNATSNTLTTSNIEYRDVGVTLTITPFLGEEDVITMDIVNDLSQVVNGSSSGSTANAQLTGIQTSHLHMETRVHVPNNHFVALSGLVDETKTHFKTGIPCLGGLPVIGALFSENDRGATKNNVIIFVRPQIVTSYSEYKKITEHQEWLYKERAHMPNLKEEFDEALDLVKLPENE